MKGPGVYITGPSRSGTSMVAGLFAAHGVFFGDTGAGDGDNPKGYFEHPALVSRVEGKCWAGWPTVWWERLREEGYQPGTWWGVKRGPQAWPWVKMLRPELIVECRRPIAEVKASRTRTDRFDPAFSKRAVELARKRIRKLSRETAAPLVQVNTSAIVQGDYRRIEKAFRKIGLWFDTERADEWVDKSLWNRGLRV